MREGVRYIAQHVSRLAGDTGRRWEGWEIVAYEGDEIDPFVEPVFTFETPLTERMPEPVCVKMEELTGEPQSREPIEWRG